MKALVTGAAHGLGRAVASELLARNAEVVGVDVDMEGMDDLVARGRGAFTARRCDFAHADEVTALLLALKGKTFDLAILNAGINVTGRFEDIAREDHERVVAVNLRAPILLASGMVREGMLGTPDRKGRRQTSRLVFVSSLSHATGYPGAAVYAATKDGLAVYAKSVTKDWKKRHGVRPLTVFPGPIRTAHAVRHSPQGAKASARQDPAQLAKVILAAAKGRKRELYPSFKAQMAAMAGSTLPFLTTRMMRRALYDKMDGITR